MEAMMNQGQMEIPEGGIGDIVALSDEDIDQIYGPEELDQLASQGRGGDTMLAHVSPGEMVIPADVVSHLGNGSSDAGSKRLYAMMDEVRKARTGTEKQGKEINPERYMPA